MDAAVKRWCLETLASARRCSSAESGRLAISDSAATAEWFVETAAFAKLAESRGIETDDPFDRLRETTRGKMVALKPLAESCPLDSETPVEVLGAIHEFLVSRRVKSSSSSPDRSSPSRKSRGVFYTPQPVIDYMIEQTLGRQLNQKSPDQVETFTILDPAAGCGAFLASVYRYLIQWYLNWFVEHDPESRPSDVVLSRRGWQLTRQRCQSILSNNIYGVDLDFAAIEVARRILWLTQMEFSADSIETDSDPLTRDFEVAHLKQGHALTGPAFESHRDEPGNSDTSHRFVWADAFPDVAGRGGFDIVIGNPPYRRERNFKQELDDIGETGLGKYRSPRMDLWYYFVHRGIQLVRDGGMLSFITNAYWLNGTGAEKLIAALRDEVHVDELFHLRAVPVFPGVQGQHLIFRLSKSARDQDTTIKIVANESSPSLLSVFDETTPIRKFAKTRLQLFRKGTLDIWPDADRFLEKLRTFPQLMELGLIRQGIAENPATINRRTIERFRDFPASADWKLGEGVFSLQDDEVERLGFSEHEARLLRPYHDLCDLGRYWSARRPSRRLIYATRKTCPEICNYPAIEKHLARFRSILDARRETQLGSNRWWHLHWPRNEDLWLANKLVALQMAVRPSFVPALEPTYVSFSANVFVPSASTQEELHYLCGILNSRVIWTWLQYHAKYRGIGLELNGHVLEQIPIRRINFENVNDVRHHDKLVSLVTHRLQLERTLSAVRPRQSPDVDDEILKTEAEIDELVSVLYQLETFDVELVNETTSRALYRSR
jgi:adenine-specific DNA-methyltransferase